MTTMNLFYFAEYLCIILAGPTLDNFVVILPCSTKLTGPALPSSSDECTKLYIIESMFLASVAIFII